MTSPAYHVQNEGYPEEGRFQMESIPAKMQSKYKASLLNKAVPEGGQGAYLRWLSYYLDYCRKYSTPPKYKKQSAAFINYWTKGRHKPNRNRLKKP
jgi:hypothetical protein